MSEEGFREVSPENILGKEESEFNTKLQKIQEAVSLMEANGWGDSDAPQLDAQQLRQLHTEMDSPILTPKCNIELRSLPGIPVNRMPLCIKIGRYNGSSRQGDMVYYQTFPRFDKCGLYVRNIRRMENECRVVDPEELDHIGS